jgi:hypothetical protein
VVTIAALAASHGVSEAAIEAVAVPDHERIGRTFVRPGVLDAVNGRLTAGMSLAEAEAVLDSHGIEETSATLSELGYRVEWEGLGGGTLARRE